MKVSPHPRLLVSPAKWQNLHKPPTHPLLRKAAGVVRKQAAAFLSSTALIFDPDLHNSLLLRAREVQVRVVTLLVRWGQTGDAAFRQAALEDIRRMGEWEFWGWDLWRRGDRDPNSEFDLSYGENSTTLALAYDWLHSSLTAEERALFHTLAGKWVFAPFLAVVQREETTRPRWFCSRHSNWNTVCAGGAGMLALVMLEELPEAPRVLELVEQSIVPYLKSLDETRGGWFEGVGYWNYGHRYAFLYLLSHERTMGRPHPLLQLRGAAETLRFPLECCPNGQPCGFGDVNAWTPLAFHYAAAERLGQKDLPAVLDQSGADSLSPSLCWPNPAELLLFHSGKVKTIAKRQPQPFCKIYPKLDWGILADRFPDSRLYLSVRGGTTEVPHSHMDLTSFHCVVENERLIDNIGINGGDEYLDTTFSSRRYELFETTPQSKNVVLINGVGITRPSEVKISRIGGKAWNGLHLDAANAMGLTRGRTPAATFYARLFLLLDGPVALVIDQLELPFPGRVEARFHTYSSVSLAGANATIRGKRQQMQLACACSVPATLYGGQEALTVDPSRVSNLIRWCTDTRTHTRVSMVTLLAPGGKPCSIELGSQGKQLLVVIHHARRRWKLVISGDLRRIREQKC